MEDFGQFGSQNAAGGGAHAGTTMPQPRAGGAGMGASAAHRTNAPAAGGGPNGAGFLAAMGAPQSVQLGMQMGQRLFGSSVGNVQGKLSEYVSRSDVKRLFAVDNLYVAKKLEILLNPFKHKDWNRQRDTARGAPSVDPRIPAPYRPPKEDINSPDLYIPMMAFVTYVLTIGFALGVTDSFNPDKLRETASQGSVAILLEMIIFKGGTFVLNAGSVPLVELVAYSSYKFVAISINMIVGLVLGKFFYYISMLYTAATIGMFTIRSLRQYLAPEGAQTHVRVSNKSYFIFFMGALQIIMVWLLGFAPRVTSAREAAHAAGSAVKHAADAAASA